MNSAPAIGSALALYADGLRGVGPVPVVRGRDGAPQRLACARWLAPADATDEAALAGLAGPVLDVGCGPGRHLRALARRGVFGLGVDLSPVAVGIARDAGVNAIVGSIFDDVPGAGTWRSALLLDGNIGIGGDPERLLRRLATLLAPGGEILVELAPQGTPTTRVEVRLERGEETSEWFPWATLADADADAAAATSGLQLRDCWTLDGRTFGRFRPRPAG